MSGSGSVSGSVAAPGGGGGAPPQPTASCAFAVAAAAATAVNTAANGPKPKAFDIGSFLDDWSDSSSDDANDAPAQTSAAAASTHAAADDAAAAADAEAEAALVEEAASVEDEDLRGEAVDTTVAVSAATMLKTMESVGRAQGAWAAGQHFKAVAHLTSAISQNPAQALLYATRAEYFLKLKRPKPAIRDSNTALSLNPESAKAYKVKGAAYAMLKQWDTALQCLRRGSQLLYDPKSYRKLKLVESKCKEKRLETLARGGC